jgi:hypothetical protein
MRKSILKGVVLFAFFTFSALAVLAQDYKALKTDAGYYFYDSVANDMIAIRIDSVAISGADMLYFNFPQIRPTENSFCYISDGASWLGDPVIEKPGGIFLFKSINSQTGIQTDTLVIKTQATLNEEWKFTSFPFSTDHIDAQVTALVNMTFIGLTDSVKIITLTRKNASGLVVPDAINNEEIRLSKNYGLIRLPKFDDFNDYIRFYEITGKTNPETGNINPDLGSVYDFEVGDEIHTHYFSNWYNYETSTEIWTIKRVTGKSISPTNDWRAYKYDICYLKTIKTSPDWIPENETRHQTIMDTIFLNSGFAEEFSKQPSQTFIDPASNWMLSTTAVLKLQRTAKFLNYNYPFSQNYPPDSCWNMILVDGACDPYYIKGLGGPYYDCPGNLFWYYLVEEVIYYKKGSETWGTPLNCDSLLQVGTEEFDIKESVKFYPNPTNGKVTITFPPATIFPCEFLLTDISGTVADKFILTSKTQPIDITNLKPGLYFARLTNDNGSRFIGKIIKK